MYPMLNSVKSWIGQLVEVGLLLVALGIVLELLFGTAGNTLFFVGNIVTNLINLINQLGQNGLVGLIALSIILWLFMKKTPNA
jgi:hypothetical protein